MLDFQNLQPCVCSLLDVVVQMSNSPYLCITRSQLLAFVTRRVVVVILLCGRLLDQSCSSVLRFRFSFAGPSKTAPAETNDLVLRDLQSVAQLACRWMDLLRMLPPMSTAPLKLLREFFVMLGKMAQDQGFARLLLFCVANVALAELLEVGVVPLFGVWGHAARSWAADVPDVENGAGAVSGRRLM